MKMKRAMISFFMLMSAFMLCGAQQSCDSTPTSDDLQRNEQEKILKEGQAQTGMPSIKNFRERKILKDILELRDQEGLVTYTYTFSDQTGRLRFFGITVGYGIPYATQYTNPEKVEWYSNHGYVNLPQADPNALFSPEAAEGTWVLMKDPNGNKVLPVYVEPRIVVSPFKLPTSVADYPTTNGLTAEQVPGR